MDDGHFNSSFKEYLSSAASGFVMGFTAPIAGGAATAGMKVLGAGLSMAGGSVVGQSIETGTVSFKQTLTDGLLGAAFGAVGEGIASSGILGKAFNFGKKKILGLVDDFIPKGPAMAEAGTGMKMSVSAADDIGKFELGKIEQTAVQRNYNAIMNPSKAIASTTDDVAEQVLVKSADDVAGRMIASSADDIVGRTVASSTDDIAVSATAGSRQAEKQLLSGSEWNEYFQQTYGAENVQWATQGQSGLTNATKGAGDVKGIDRITGQISKDKPVVVIGESMDRVNPVAEQLKQADFNVKTYNPRNFRSSPGNLNRLDVEANRSWIKYWTQERDATIIDIGIDPSRTARSPFYGVENRSIYQNWNYPNVIQYKP